MLNQQLKVELSCDARRWRVLLIAPAHDPFPLCKMFTILSQRNKKCTSLSKLGVGVDRRQTDRGTRG